MKFYPPHEYQPVAQELFEKLQSKIHQELPYAKIEHIGSSSIEGCISKGDLDIYVEVPAEQMDASITLIESLNFKIKEGSFRSRELCPFYSEDYGIEVGVQLVAKNSKFTFFLIFRDQMRARPSLVVEYNRLKADSVGLSESDYRKIKSRFIERLLEAELKFLPIDLEQNEKICVEFRYDSFVASFGPDSSTWPQRFDSKEYISWLKLKAARDPALAIHVWQNDQIIGQMELGFLKDVPGIGYVNLYYLAPDYRGKGYSKSLDEYAEKYFLGKRVPEIRLSVSPTNHRAMTYYKKCGWMDLGPRKDHPEVHFMSKKLSTPSLRRARPEDAPAIHDAHMRSIQALCAKDYSAEQINAWGRRPYNEAQCLRKIKEDLVWVIEQSGVVEGYAHLQIKELEEKKAGYISALYLTDRVAGLGLGKKAMNEIEKITRESGHDYIELSSTLTSLGFYRHMGYTETDGPRFTEMRGVRIPCIPMIKSLRANQ